MTAKNPTFDTSAFVSIKLPARLTVASVVSGSQA